MKQSMRPFAVICLVLFLVLATEIGTRVAEARTCGSPSHRFKGLCTSSRNCENTCNTEGFPGGECKGFRRRCICNGPCV
ncbi:defensin-like protein [Chenopodium quinoa]|uniref:defensin-like protein n=1 Tax=Chenopodium quinoa TaxID=63459 RepID=UPI000B7952F6|nr:defensin-like protein [Chenopodium quinoa]